MQTYPATITVTKTKVEFTPIGSGLYQVFVDGIQVSEHITEEEALNAARQLSSVDNIVKVTHDYEVDVATITYVSPSLAVTNPTTGSPVILYTDIVAGPTSGGEGNNGAYLGIYGYDFGASLGNITVTINSTEVATYKVLEDAISQPFSGMGLTLQCVRVQVGSLGGLAAGASASITLTLLGADSNTDHTFTNQPGDMIYVALTGNDSTGDGSFANPYRLMQNSGKSNPAWSGWGPGNTLIMRGGTWSDIGANNKFFRIDSSVDGSAPTGSVGVGYLGIMGYPGETITINTPEGGGFVGPGSAFNNEANYVQISNLGVHDDTVKAFGNGGDGPIYSSSSGANWRIVNNELTAKVGTAVDQRASGIGGGYSNAALLGNYIHDIQGKVGGGGPSLLNHGMYFDHTCDTCEIAYNHIKDVPGGNSIQWFGETPYTAQDVHHNLLDNSGKHGLNDAGLDNSNMYNNIVINIDEAGYRRANSNASNVNVICNTFYNCNTSNNPNRATWYEDAQQQSGGPLYQNNINHIVGGQNYYANNTIFQGGTILDTNVYFGDGTGPTKDGSAITGDPLYVAAGTDFRLQNGVSPAEDTGTAPSITISNDFIFNLRSAISPSVGAVEDDG